MQTKFLIATALVVLFALATAKWSWVEDEDRGHSSAIAGHETLLALGGSPYEAETLLALGGSPYEAEVLQQQGSLSANHQEAKDADALLNALIKRLTQQIADDSAATNQKVSDRSNSIKKFDDAINSAKAYLDDLTLQLAALNKKIDEAKTALATRQGEKTAEQAAIDKENAEQKARLAERIAAVEKQIALIKQILVLLSATPIDPLVPDSIILDGAQEKTIAGLFTNTAYANKKFVRCFLASASGYASSAYNQACNGKTPLLTIVKAASGNVFGGFTTVALDGSGNYKSDSNAFLYSLVRGGQTNLVKIPIGQYPQYAGYTHPSYGPTFGGGHDLYIADKCNANQGSYSNFGHSYAAPSGITYGQQSAQTYLAGSYQFTCADYEVFQLV